jgi:hypothetical protein
MMLEGQLGQPQQAPALIEIASPPVRWSIGLLGNDTIQVPLRFADPDSLLASYRKVLVSAQPGFRLGALKLRKFTLEGKPNRSAASLAALNAPQPTELTLAQWKQIVEEIEDED